MFLNATKKNYLAYKREPGLLHDVNYPNWLLYTDPLSTRLPSLTATL